MCVFFDDRLLRGNRSVKVDSRQLSAFDSPNFPWLAAVGTEIRLNQGVFLSPPKRRFNVHTQLNTCISVVRLIPGFDDQYFIDMVRCASTKGKPIIQSDSLTIIPSFLSLSRSKDSRLRGIILALYGTGNAPTQKREFIEAVKEAIDKGIIVVACSQCLRGMVRLHKYAVGSALHSIGVVSAGDMTIEATATKLSYLIGKGLDNGQVRESIGKSLTGELTETLLEESGGKAKL